MARALSNPVRLSSPEKGVDGRTTLAGARTPTITDGRIGDFWIDTDAKKLYGPKNAGGWPDNGLIKGDKGWAPVFGVVSDGTRRVQRVVDWQGGEGSKPTTGLYVGASGLTATIGEAVDIRGPEGPEMVIDNLDAATTDISDETQVPVAEAENDNEKRTVVEIYDLGGRLERYSVAHAEASTVRKNIKRIRTQFYDPSYAIPSTLVGGATYKRVNEEPAHAGKFRTLDRWTAEGESDSENGGWWEIDEQVINAQMFGVRGNGTDDDRVAAQKAIDVGYALGRPVYFPTGDYLLSAASGRCLRYYDSSVIYGDGIGKSNFKRKAGAEGHVFDAETGVTDAHLHHITVDGNREAETPGEIAGYHGIRGAGTVRLRVHDCEIKNAIYYGIGLQGNDNIEVDPLIVDCIIHNCGGYSTSGHEFGDGIDMKSSLRAKVQRNRIYECAQKGIDVRGTDYEISGNNVSDCVHDGIQVRGRGGLSTDITNIGVVSNNHVYGCLDGVTVFSDGTVPRGEVRIIGNRCSGNSGHGIFINDDDQDTIISSNQCSSNGGAGIRAVNNGCHVTGNSLLNNGTYGFDNGAQDLKQIVSQNRAAGNATNQIRSPGGSAALHVDNMTS